MDFFQSFLIPTVHQHCQSILKVDTSYSGPIMVQHVLTKIAQLGDGLWTLRTCRVSCCLIHITIILLRQILNLVHLCPCLGIGLFMPYLSDLLFISSIIFIVIDCITSIKHALAFCTLFTISNTISFTISPIIFG